MLPHWNNSPLVDMLLNSDTLSSFRATHYPHSEPVCYFFLILSEQYQNPVWKIVETDKIDTPNTYTWRSLLACYRHFNEKWLVRLVLCAQASPVSEMMRACKCISHASEMPTFTCNWMSSNLVEIWLLKAIITNSTIMLKIVSSFIYECFSIRERPFNLKGGRGLCFFFF